MSALVLSSITRTYLEGCESLDFSLYFPIYETAFAVGQLPSPLRKPLKMGPLRTFGTRSMVTTYANGGEVNDRIPISIRGSFHSPTAGRGNLDRSM